MAVLSADALIADSRPTPAVTWAEAVEFLKRLPGTPTRITFPGECPDLYQTLSYGCPVVRGDRFTVRMSDGRLIEP